MAGLKLFSLTVTHPTEDFLEQLGAEVIPAILQVLLDQQQDNMLSELCISAIHDWTANATCNEEMRSTVIETLSRFVHSAFKLTRQAYSQFLYVISDIADKLDPDGEHFDTTATLRSFCLASLRSASAMDRLLAVRAFFRMIPEQPSSPLNEFRVVHVPPWDATVQGLRAYFGVNVSISDATRFGQLTRHFYRSLRDFCTHKSFNQLARVLYAIILEDPRVVTFEKTLSLTLLVPRNPRQAGLPFDTWDRTLDRCCHALRMETGHTSDLVHDDMLRVLEISSHLQRKDFAAAADLARPITESPGRSFWFWYALSTSPYINDTARVSTTIQYGFLKEQRLPRKLKKTALYRATLANVASRAMTSLLDMSLQRSARSWETYSTLVIAARVACHFYQPAAPYDDRDAEMMGDIHAIMSIVYCGPLFTGTSRVPNVLNEVRSRTFGGMALADATSQPRWRDTASVCRRTWRDMHRSFLRMTVQILTSEYSPSVDAWESLNRHFPATPLSIMRDAALIDNAAYRGDVYAERRASSASQVARWRAVFRGEWNGRYARSVCWSDAPPELLDEILLLDYPDVKTQSCSFCARRSIVLYRCPACRRVRYCDENWCVRAWNRPTWLNLNSQRDHWREAHRQECIRDYL